MLELYHGEPAGASARVLMVLAEKGVDFVSRPLDLLEFEQHRPEFVALNRSGEVPVLVADGVALTEASYISEYLDEAFPAPALMPADPALRWDVRAWQKHVDDYLDVAASMLAWQRYGLPLVQARNRAALDEAVSRIPRKERRDLWQAALDGFAETELARSRDRVAETVRKVEGDLAAGDWLVGSSYSLADIAAFAFLNYVPGLMPKLLAGAPRTADWLRRITLRPATMAMLAHGRAPDPFMTAAPGPEPVRWG